LDAAGAAATVSHAVVSLDSIGSHRDVHLVNGGAASNNLVALYRLAGLGFGLLLRLWLLEFSLAA
jgi:hypothetical protein